MGRPVPGTAEDRINLSIDIPHKPSILQDLEAGRPMEIDALLGSVVELAEMVELPVPTCRTVLALVRSRGRVAGCY